MKSEPRSDAFELARAQLAGGVSADFDDHLCTCQRCGDDVNVTIGLEPCAFCNGCKDAVLDILATRLLEESQEGRPPIVVGDESFKSQTALRTRVRAVLNGGYREVVGQDAKFLVELFRRHERAEQKFGVGVARVWVVRLGGKPSFEIERLDGSRADISYKKCLRPATPRNYFVTACRSVVEDQVEAARERAFARSVHIVCPLSGVKFMKSESQVHHQEPYTFEAIVDAFIGEQQLDIATVEYAHGDGVTGNKFVDPALARGFSEFHQRWAILQVVSRRAHQKEHRDSSKESA